MDQLHGLFDESIARMLRALQELEAQPPTPLNQRRIRDIRRNLGYLGVFQQDLANVMERVRKSARGEE